jgi:hypothetical protein
MSDFPTHLQYTKAAIMVGNDRTLLSTIQELRDQAEGFLKFLVVLAMPSLLNAGRWI